MLKYQKMLFVQYQLQFTDLIPTGKKIIAMLVYILRTEKHFYQCQPSKSKNLTLSLKFFSCRDFLKKIS